MGNGGFVFLQGLGAAGVCGPRKILSLSSFVAAKLPQKRIGKS